MRSWAALRRASNRWSSSRSEISQTIDEQDYLADSMTDALITNLGQISGLRVISRTSAMTYKSTSKTVPQIARELNVDAVVEGTVQRSAGRVRLNLKLIRGVDRSDALGAELRARPAECAGTAQRNRADHREPHRGDVDAARERAPRGNDPREPESLRSLSEGTLFLEPAVGAGHAAGDRALRGSASTRSWIRSRPRRAGGFLRAVWIVRLDPGRRSTHGREPLPRRRKRWSSTSVSPTGIPPGPASP